MKSEPFQDAETDIEALTGVKVGHTAQQRMVQRQTFELPDAKPPVTEVSVDGGKVRLRGVKAGESWWRDYKAVRLEGIYYGAFFHDNQALIDYVNSIHYYSNPDVLVCFTPGVFVSSNLQDRGNVGWSILS